MDAEELRWRRSPEGRRQRKEELERLREETKLRQAERRRAIADTKRQRIEHKKDRIAYLRALLDRRQKQFEDQYPFCSPVVNQGRLAWLDIRRLRLALLEWDLAGLKTQLEEWEEDD